jgi:transposase InsO family protein
MDWEFQEQGRERSEEKAREEIEEREEQDAGTARGPREYDESPRSWGAEETASAPADAQARGKSEEGVDPPSGPTLREPRAGEEHRADSGDGVGEDPARQGAQEPSDGGAVKLPRLPLLSPRRGRHLRKKDNMGRVVLTATQRLLLLDTWKRSGLPAGDFSALVGVSMHTLYAWKKRFSEQGPAGLEDQPRGGRKGSRLPEVTRRAILLMKEEHPDWGCQRISDLLFRGPALPASPSAVSRVLHEAGYELEETPTRRHRDRPRRFERERPNQLWQSDIFTFMLKRQNRRVYLVAFLDDHSRFITGWGLHSTQSAALVLEVLRSAITSYNPPREILTDNGSQYVTWRGRSAFSRELERRGIDHVVSAPRRPQTLGKIERFWGSLWREFLELAVFLDLQEARERIGCYVDYYNFRRPHQGIDGLAPADRFFDAAPKVLEMLRQRVEQNALEIARHGRARKPFYLTGQVEGKSFSVHTEGERVVVQREDEGREEVDLDAASVEPAPGTSPIDDLLEGGAREEEAEPERGREEGDER